MCTWTQTEPGRFRAAGRSGPPPSGRVAEYRGGHPRGHVIAVPASRSVGQATDQIRQVAEQGIVKDGSAVPGQPVLDPSVPGATKRTMGDDRRNRAVPAA